MWWFKRKGPSGFSYSSTAEEVTEGIDGSGLTAIVTGASSGIGTETARVLALRGVHVIMGVRNMEAGKGVKGAIAKEIPAAKIDAMELDLSSMASVRKFASEFNSLNLPLNLLINNAGIMATPFMLSKDNIELQFATNHIGHFLLTNLLLDTMKKTSVKMKKEGRIVNVSSMAHKLTYPEGIRFDRINDQAGYNIIFAYGQSKLANVLHANELSRRLKDAKTAHYKLHSELKIKYGIVFVELEDGAEITANSLHPGAVTTNLFRHYSFVEVYATLEVLCSKNYLLVSLQAAKNLDTYPLLSCAAFPFGVGLVGKLGSYVLKNVQQGAATTCYLALHPQVKGITGEYFADSNLAKASKQGTDVDLAKKLWDFSMNLVK